MADSKREVAALPVEAMCSLDAVFQKSRLPSRASSYHALQVGGWLAKRYSSLGEPWPHLAAALGVSQLPVSHSAATGPGFFAKNIHSDMKVTKMYGTRSNARRSKRKL